jgi:hypothetical protein
MVWISPRSTGWSDGLDKSKVALDERTLKWTTLRIVWYMDGRFYA